MKYTIEGFSQEKLVEFGMDVNDAIILRWFVDFKDSGKMASEIVNDDKYYWINYEELLKDLPIINMKKDTLYRRLKKMESVNLLKHYTKKQGGTYSMYTLGSNYCKLIDFEGYGFKSDGYGTKSVGVTDLNPEQKINLLNKTNLLNSKTEEPVAVSDKESKIRFIANIEKIKLDEKFIKELANKFSLEKITEWFKAVPKDKKSNNAGAYIRGIIKNQKLDSVTNTVTKKSEKIETIEEPLNTPKMSEKEIRETFLDGKELKDLDKLQLKILNDTLRRMGYEEIKPNN